MKTLIALLVRDAERSRTEVGAIDFHIPSYSQDQSELQKLTVKAETTVKANFENFGERTVVTLTGSRKDCHFDPASAAVSVARKSRSPLSKR